MQELVKGVNALAIEELIRANGNFPLFHSDHEGLAVIEEEVEEATIEAHRLSEQFEIFKRSVFTDMDDWKKQDDIRDIRKTALLCACETIQVIAMCDKFRMSKEAKK